MKKAHLETFFKKSYIINNNYTLVLIQIQDDEFKNQV